MTPNETALPARVAVDDKGNYWRDYGDHYSMPPVSDDNEPVEVIAYYVRLQGKPMPFLSRLLHGWRTPRHLATTCCSHRWERYASHLRFAHNEEVVIPERETVPCFCGAPAVGWTYSVMGDGQTINGLAVCQKHQEENG